MVATSRKSRPRDAGRTRARILAAATAEFAGLGFAGARVERIAARARINKQLLYHYFINKDGLFTAVLETAYGDFRAAEAALELDHFAPVEAMRRLVAFTWDYYLRKPGFIDLVNSENLNRAAHIARSEAIRATSRPFVARMRGLLARGEAAGVFRAGIDPMQLNITIAAIGYYYLTNRFTGAIVFERDLMSEAALAERLAFNIETVLRLVCSPQAVAA